MITLPFFPYAQSSAPAILRLCSFPFPQPPSPYIFFSFHFLLGGLRWIPYISLFFRPRTRSKKGSLFIPVVGRLEIAWPLPTRFSFLPSSSSPLNSNTPQQHKNLSHLRSFFPPHSFQATLFLYLPNRPLFYHNTLSPPAQVCSSKALSGCGCGSSNGGDVFYDPPPSIQSPAVTDPLPSV